MATNYTDTKTALLTATIGASIPLVTEALMLLTDAVKELRADLDRERIKKSEVAPLERDLAVARARADLAELKARHEQNLAARANSDA